MSSIAVARVMTAEALARVADDDFFYELDEGELIRMAPAGADHGWIEDILHVILSNHVTKHRLGKIYSGDTGFLLQSDPDVVRAPDIAFVRQERMPVKTHRSGYIVGAPDLAVEIQSPSQSPADLNRKVQQYLAAGTQVVWVLHPRRRQAKAYGRDGSVQIFSAVQYLQSAGLLPGLRVPLAKIFKPQ
jgi:Uma2 family endonuclease